MALTRPRPKKTGPDNTVRGLTLKRDEWCCAWCGRDISDGHPYSLQHRGARGMGGTRRPEANSPVNLITLDGTATTGCHGQVTSRINYFTYYGYVVRSGITEPADIPIWLPRREGWFYLLPDYTLERRQWDKVPHPLGWDLP